jgi:hypothetical protein
MNENGRRQKPAAAFLVVLPIGETTSTSEAALPKQHFRSSTGRRSEAGLYLPKYCARFLSKSPPALSFRALSFLSS